MSGTDPEGGTGRQEDALAGTATAPDGSTDGGRDGGTDGGRDAGDGTGPDRGRGGPGQRRALARLPWGKVRLTPVEEEDLELFHRWQNDAHLRDMTMGFRFPIPRERVREWIRGLAPQGMPTRAVYAIRCDGALAGSAQLYDIQPVHRTAGLGVTAAAEGVSALGVGHVAAVLLLDFAFRSLDLRRIEVECLDVNHATIRGLEHLGFRHEGTRRQGHYVGGRAHDTQLYGLLREEFTVWPPEGAHLLARRFPED